MPVHSFLRKSWKEQDIGGWIWNDVFGICRKRILDVELRCSMVEIQFVDGTKESIETYRDTSYEYNSESECFLVWCDKEHYAMFPREFVKSIRYIEV